MFCTVPTPTSLSCLIAIPRKNLTLGQKTADFVALGFQDSDEDEDEDDHEWE
jgi:hypothetical protein